MQVVFLPVVQRPSLVLFVDIGQQHVFGVPAQHFLGCAGLDFAGLSAFLSVEDVDGIRLAAHCRVFAVVAERNTSVGGI